MSTRRELLPMNDAPQTTGPKFSDTEVSTEILAFLLGRRGIRIVPDGSFRGFKGPVHQPEAYNLAKWIRQKEQSISVEIDDAPVVDLRSVDCWLPLVFLATDVALPFYINLVAAYVYDRARGALKHDQPTVHVKAVHRNEKTGVTKLFSYDGPVDGLKACAKKIDLDAMMRDE